MNFALHTIAPAPELLPVNGVFALAALRATGDATVAAARIRSDARDAAEAEQVLAAERSRAERAAFQAATLAQAEAMLAVLAQLEQRFLDQAAPMVADLAQALFLRLAGQLAPAERVAAMLHQLRLHAPPRLADAVLRMHPDDTAAMDVAAVAPGWRIDPDAALSPGCCRLEAASGEWCFDFDGAALALVAGLHDAAGK
jgi:flagellar biosynthesis/type III secretory pathway protein FliH